MDSGKAQSVALALSEHMPIDAMGFPVGKSTKEVARTIKKPVSISQEHWLMAIDVAVEHFRMTAGLIEPTREKLEALSTLPKETWNVIYHHTNIDRYHSALALKGILKKGAGLTFDQRRCLNVLTDLSIKGDLQVRLKKCGVSWDTFQNWQRDAAFKSQLDAITQSVTADAEPLIMMELTRGAVEGNLAKMQYFHQLSGRFDPNRQQQQDIKSFMVGLMEIMQEFVTDPDQLRKLAGRLQALHEKTIGSD